MSNESNFIYEDHSKHTMGTVTLMEQLKLQLISPVSTDRLTFAIATNIKLTNVFLPFFCVLLLAS